MKAFMAALLFMMTIVAVLSLEIPGTSPSLAYRIKQELNSLRR
jgi:hypothetical protein